MFKAYNTLTRKKEDLGISKNGVVKIYNCGPTVYSRQTIGNFRTFVFSDLLRRTLEYLGYEVDQVMNITDVGHLTMTEEQKRGKDLEITDTESGVDRMEKAASQENLTVWQVAEKYTELFLEDLEALNIIKPKVMPKATDHIPEQIAMIQKLIDRGYAYVTKTAVYFDTAKFKDYNRLSGQELNEKLTAVRNEVEKDSTKRNPADFRLWQLNQPDHSMLWDSPWGKGYPGWHIECSAMSMKYLGQPIDIHTGGTDHIPVHHTHEIAQSEGATGKKFVRIWMHAAFLVVDGKRMGKSLGNAYTLADLKAKGFEPLELRYFYLGAHYRQILNFTWEALTAAKKRLHKLRQEIDLWRRQSAGKGRVIAKLKSEFDKALEDDLNLPRAIAVLNELLTVKATPQAKLATAEAFDSVLGLNLVTKSELTGSELEQIERLIADREKFRRERNWLKSDELRKLLADKYNVSIEDTPGGTIWKKLNS
jgi:cysteinyl-tRNA synthetase